MKPLKKSKIVMAILSMMLIGSELTVIPVHATPTDPDTDTTTNTDTTNPGDGTTNPDGGTTNPGDGTTDPDGGTTNPGDGTTNPDGGTTSPGDGTTGEEEEEEYVPSTINTLASLKVEGFELSPAFDSSITEYSLTIDGSHKKITISATRDDYLSYVTGTGDFDVSWQEGSYDFKISCVAESGHTRNYVIHLTVSSDPYLFAYCGGEELGFVLKGLDSLAVPEGFALKEGSYNGEEITVFTNSNFPFSLVYLEKENKKQDWYCYQNGAVTGLFRSLIINKTKYYYAGVDDNSKKQTGYSYSEISVSGEKLNGWKVKNDATKVMLYLYDSVGNADFYIYDTDEQTMQRRREYEVTETKESRSLLKSPVVITAMIIVVIAFVFGIIFLKDGKKHVAEHPKKKNKEPEDIDNGQFDHTVELVRTGKIKIFADTPEDEINQTKEFKKDELNEVVKTKEFKLEDLNIKQNETTILDDIVEEDDIHKSIKETIKGFEEDEVESLDVDEINEVVIEKSKDEIVEDTAETKDEVVESTVETTEEVVEEAKEVTEVIEEVEPKKKKGFFFKKKKKEKQEKIIEEKVEEKIEEEKVEEPIVKNSFIDEKEPIPEIDEEEALNEIQKYLDQLFYLDEEE